MGGHVNMMDDVLISNLPPNLLRSALRTLVAQGSATQRVFVQHVRDQLSDSAPDFVLPSLLFPRDDEVSPECERYLALTRCLFSSKLTQPALSYLEYFAASIRASAVRWSNGSQLERVLEAYGGDVVQAVQAIKESRPVKSSELQQLLGKLLSSLEECRLYCENAEPWAMPHPFSRPERQVTDLLRSWYPEQGLGEARADPTAKSLVAVQMPSPVRETCKLGPFDIPRLLNGLWQLSSPAWGSGTAEKQESALTELIEHGFVAADMADHYGDAELVFGDFRNRLPPPIRKQVYTATKWCVFGPLDHPVTHEWVLAIVRERCRRVGGRIELLQFHWYDYEVKDYLQILAELVAITKSHAALVASIGLCNFDSEHTQEACEYLRATTGTVGLVSNQVQFSVVDSRPLMRMCDVCAKYGLKLLTYGSFCGGFLSSRWLGQPAPEPYSESRQLTPSQRKYFEMISDWGSWSRFQLLLEVLSQVARKHEVSVSNVATRWVLQQPQVGAVIVGTRLGVSANVEDNLNVFGWSLDDADTERIDQLALGTGHELTRKLFEKLGDCGNEYRSMH
ncbi:putative aryl-alcohol dehydrogenase [Xylariomycetidae sp. FL0641]|nr:putative aryl-alcohol dehydrogenase [Xylariomycetidae sp. FL0641]